VSARDRASREAERLAEDEVEAGARAGRDSHRANQRFKGAIAKERLSKVSRSCAFMCVSASGGLYYVNA